MKDIVKQLRDVSDPDVEVWDLDDIADAAADEIEKLRGEGNSMKHPDPDKVAAALERASLDTPRQYDDRKTLAYQVQWYANEIEILKLSAKGWRADCQLAEQNNQDRKAEITKLRAELRGWEKATA